MQNLIDFIILQISKGVSIGVAYTLTEKEFNMKRFEIVEYWLYHEYLTKLIINQSINKELKIDGRTYSLNLG